MSRLSIERLIQTVLASLLLTVSVMGQTPQPVPPAPVPSPNGPKAEIKHLPKNAEPSRETATVGELLQLKGSADCRWGFDPSTATNSYLLPDGNGNASFSASAPGTYYVVAFNNVGETWFRIDVGGNVNPGPLPPTPGPTPPPAPVVTTGPVAKVVFVEDSTKPGVWRNKLFGSTKVQDFFLTNNITHSVIDIKSGDTDAESVAFTKAAEGKTLPYFWAYDAKGNQITEQTVQLDNDPPGSLIAALSAVPHKRALGNNPPNGNKLKGTWKVFGDSPNVPLLERSQWDTTNDLLAYLSPVKDQDGVGACNAFATVTAVEGCRAQAGMKRVILSPGYLYGNINGGSDNGSTLEDGMAWMMQNGTCSAATVPELTWQKRKWPASAAKEAQQYIVLETFLCPDFKAVASALSQGFYVIVGIAWYDSYQNVDADGWLPAPRGQWGGHALCCYGVAKRGNSYGAKTRNSWGTSWGKEGNFVIPESAFGSSIGGFWAVRAVKRTPSDFPVVPKGVSSLMEKKLYANTEPQFNLAP